MLTLLNLERRSYTKFELEFGFMRAFGCPFLTYLLFISYRMWTMILVKAYTI